jgi:hypothetical protein
MPNWLVGKVTVTTGVNFQDEGWEEDIHTQALHLNEPTPMLTLVGTEAV